MMVINICYHFTRYGAIYYGQWEAYFHPIKIANSLVSAGRKIDNKTVERYLQGLQDSLLLYKVNRYDVRGKELLRINAKYYSVDVTLRNLLVEMLVVMRAIFLENIVFLELIRSWLYSICRPIS